MSASNNELSSSVLADMIERWNDMTTYMTEEVRTRWWKRILDAYSEKHRKYHNLYHIYQLFQHYDEHKDSLHDRYACAFAIFFHDIVYDPRAKDNESKSADLFREFSKETTLDSTNYVSGLIEATVSHCTDAHMDKNSFGSDDIHYIVDFDMAILGADVHDYDQYRKQIREEFSHLDNETYRKERCKVLELFLKIPNIYATREFRDAYESNARANIHREIEILHNGDDSH